MRVLIYTASAASIYLLLTQGLNIALYRVESFVFVFVNYLTFYVFIVSIVHWHSEKSVWQQVASAITSGASILLLLPVLAKADMTSIYSGIVINVYIGWVSFAGIMYFITSSIASSYERKIKEMQDANEDRVKEIRAATISSYERKMKEMRAAIILSHERKMKEMRAAIILSHELKVAAIISSHKYRKEETQIASSADNDIHSRSQDNSLNITSLEERRVAITVYPSCWYCHKARKVPPDDLCEHCGRAYPTETHRVEAP